MPKREKTPPPLLTVAAFESLTHKMLEAPHDALRQLEDDADGLAALAEGDARVLAALSERDARFLDELTEDDARDDPDSVEVFRGMVKMASTPDGRVRLARLLRASSQLPRRHADRLRAGRDEAQSIMAMLDPADPAIGGLRAHLKAQPPSPECVIWLLFENRRLSASKAARTAAQSKNAAPRKFVADAWATRADRGQSKASFARMVAPLVKQRFDLIVTPDRIARRWLPRK